MFKIFLKRSTREGSNLDVVLVFYNQYTYNQYAYLSNTNTKWKAFV